MGEEISAGQTQLGDLALSPIVLILPFSLSHWDIWSDNDLGLLLHTG
jgi:hypothetical protein